MRHARRSEMVRFYAPPGLVAALKQKADEQHMTPSELLRQAVRREVLEAA